MWNSCVETLHSNCSFWTDRVDDADIGTIPLSLLEEIFEMVKSDPNSIPKWKIWALTRWYSERIWEWLGPGIEWWNQELVEHISEDEKQRLQKLADSVVLDSMCMNDIIDIQPCPFFSQDRLYNAIVKCRKKNPF